MGQIYSIPFTAVAVSAAQDVFEVTAGTGKPFTVHEITLGQYSDAGDAQAELLGVSIKRGAGHTAGSGGSTVTPAKMVSTAAASAATAGINNTSQAAAGAGTLTVLRSESFNVQGGYQYLPIPVQRPLFLATEACIVAITAPADAVTLSGTMVIEENPWPMSS